MSEKELKFWWWLLGVSGISSVLIFVLPVNGLILLMYLFVGMLMAMCPPIFIYSSLTFGLNAALAQSFALPVALRILISASVVWAGGNVLSIALNAERTATYNRLVAEDVALTVKPLFTRLVVADDRHDTTSRSRPYICGSDCSDYLMRGKVRTMLFPADAQDSRPFYQRDYKALTHKTVCPPSRHLPINGRGVDICDDRGTKTAIAPGDLLIHAFSITVPYQTKKCLCYRIEAYFMTPSGMTLIARETVFQMTAYANLPFPTRDAGWNGSNFDNGMTWLTGRLERWPTRQKNSFQGDDGFPSDMQAIVDDVLAARQGGYTVPDKKSH